MDILYTKAIYLSGFDPIFVSFCAKGRKSYEFRLKNIISRLLEVHYFNISNIKVGKKIFLSYISQRDVFTTLF